MSTKRHKPEQIVNLLRLIEAGIVQTASSHANAKDGLDASLVEKTYEELGKQIGIASK